MAFDLSFAEEERSFLPQGDRLGMLKLCQQCQECIPTCPKGVDVPTLMRTYMYAAQDSNFPHVHMTLNAIPP